MNAKKILATLVLVLAMFVFLASCTVTVECDHVYDWEMQVEPTEQDTGIALGTCEFCGDANEFTVPALTDSEVWTKEITPATHKTTGLAVYTSIYGEVEITLELVPHEWSYALTVAPTEEAEGQGKKTCECGATEDVVVPVLTDASHWSVAVTLEPSHTAEGEKVYTSAIYGDVAVAIQKDPTHIWGEWSLTEAPTELGVGAAERVCVCGDVDTTVVAALTDASVWTAAVVTPANYNAAGVMGYTSIYGYVEGAIAKLVAPYDGKTYTNLVFDGQMDNTNKVINAQDTWSNATLTLDANGFGFCTSYPYRGFTQITMEDPATGKIKITIYDMTTVDAEGNTLADPIPNYDSYVSYSAYVDFATGMIVRTRNSSFDYIVLYIPGEVAPSEYNAVASSWNGNAMAITYTQDGASHSIFCTAEKAYFGVSFVDAEGNAVAANACFDAPYVYIKDAQGQLIASFGFDGEKQNALDGYEGTYTNAENGDLFVSGFGTLTLGGVSGNYTVAAADAAHHLDVYLRDALGNVTHFYLVVLSGNTYTLSEPKVTVQFVTGDYAAEDPQTVNKFVPMELPTYTHATMTFKGWYYDEACTEAVASPFVPTADVTLYAKWKAKVVVTLVGTLGDDVNTLYLGEGDVIGDFLPTYGLDADNYKKFVAWYVDINGNGELDAEDMPLDMETTIGADDTGATIIAKWEDLPAYYGTYYGVEIWNASYGNSSKTAITIDENGNMSGLKNGVIISYDPETQLVSWMQTGRSDIFTFYFDAETGVIAGMYNNYNIGNDYYLYSRYTQATNGKVDAHYGVKAPQTPGSTTFGYYAQFITVDTKLGEDTTIFLYNNHIYNDVTITTADGIALTPATVKNAKTVVVKDNKTGNIIVSVASIGTSFNANNNTVALDAYFGTYQMGDETVALDGTGIITYNGKTGSYTATANGFDVYFAENGVNTEYYTMTLDTAAKTCTLTKPMVNVTLDVDGKDVEVSQIGATNSNISVALPTLSHENFVFRGWYVAGDESKTPVGESYIPTADVTLVALWKAKYTLTIVYNDGITENTVLVFGEGEIATLEQPAFAKHKFDGWFTTAIFAEDSAWANGSAINGNTTIYAKWSDAPIYNLTYTVTEVERSNDANITGLYKAYTRTAACFTIDPDGKSPKTSYPFATGDITITNYDPATGSLTFNCGTKSYKGFVDSVSGIMLVNYKDGDADMQEFFLLNPFATNSIATQVSASYWNGGSTACIVYHFDDNTSYTIFVNDNQVYFGVSFVDAEGNAVAGNACYQSSMLYVRDAEGNVVAYFAYNGETMCELDGNEGTYAGENGSLVLSGFGTLTLGGVNGSYAQNENGTFDVYLYNAEGAVTMYYVLTLDKANGSYATQAVPVVLSFVSEHGAVEAQNAYAYVPSVLPTLTQTGFVFRGWYVQGDATQTIVDASAFVTGENITLVAKWDALLSFTVVLGNTLDTVVDYYGAGDTPVLVEPGYTNGKAFAGWYLDALCTVPYEGGAITENTTVYAAWMEAHPMFGSYTGANVYGSSSTGSTNSGGSSNVSISIDAQGVMTGKTSGTIRDYDPETGMFKIYPDDSKYYLGVYDAETGIMIFNYSTGRTEMINDVYIYAPGNTFKCNNTLGSYWNGGKTKIGTIQCDAGEINYFMFDNRIYTNVTWTSDDGVVAAKDAYNASNLSVYDNAGNFIAYFAKESGKGLVYKVSDGLLGTYTDAEGNTMVLNGFGAGHLTAEGLNNAAITYTVEADGSLLAVAGKAYYAITLDGNTFTATHLKYTVSFVTGIDGFTVDPIVVEHKSSTQLPANLAVEGYKFEGWYTTPEFTSRVYWHEENADTTYYAKWSSVCTVTLVYGDGIDNVLLSYSSGASLSMGATLSPDGKGLYIWYTDEAHTELFSSTTVTGSMKLYGVKVAEVTYGSYKFVDKDGSLVSDNKSKGSSTASMTITMLGNYTVSYDFTVSSESGWDKATFKHTVDGTTTTVQNAISGSKSGTETAVLSAGDSMNFSYTKDSSGNSGNDCVTLVFTITPNA